MKRDPLLDSDGLSANEFYKRLAKRARRCVLDCFPNELDEGTIQVFASLVLDYWASLPVSIRKAEGLIHLPRYLHGAKSVSTLSAERCRDGWEKIFRSIVKVEEGYWGHPHGEEGLTSRLKRFIDSQRELLDLRVSIARGGALQRKDDQGKPQLLCFPPSKRPRDSYPQCLKLLAVCVSDALRNSSLSRKSSVFTLRLLDRLGAYHLAGSRSDTADFRRVLVRWRKEIEEAEAYTKNTFPER